MILTRALTALALAACISCGHETAARQAVADVPPAHPTGIPTTQTVPSNPCAWLPQPVAEKIMGETLARAPLRVFSAENSRPSDMGDACLYEPGSASDAPKAVIIQLIADESGAMQTAFAGMGNVEKEFRGTSADLNAASAWDYVGAMPGGLIALRRGRVAVQMTASASMSDKGFALATAMLQHMLDIPFASGSGDAAVPAQGPDPCRLVTRAEAEALLGSLIVAPYRSRKSTALAYGSGGSCSYFTGQHRALVVTPKESHGAQLFSMLGGSEAKVGGLLHTPNATRAPAGDWDRMSIGIDGTLHALKNDKMLSVQFITSPADLNAAAKFVAIALARF
jgi:hypothetical protein